MRIAFYAPMKPPTHPSPSGDRRVARLLMAALERAGHEVELAARFRAYEGDGDETRQAALKAKGAATAQALIESYRAGEKPALWFTYHLYHKAPDWLGPAVSEALGIPYVIAEASFAAKQARGPYALNNAAAAQAIARADAVISFTPEDEEGVAPLVRTPGRLHRLAPFLEPKPYQIARAKREVHRAALAAKFGLDPAPPWLLAVGMMRPGDKLASYRLLARALAAISAPSFAFLAVGDGEARATVESEFAALGPGRVAFAGRQMEKRLPAFYAAADLMAWPAVNEAYGMALLEAQAAGLPVVAGKERGVGEIVEDGETGILVEPRDPMALAEAVSDLLQDRARRGAMAAAAQEKVRTRHSLDAASGALDTILRALVRA